MTDNITIVRAVYSGLCQRQVASTHQVSRNTVSLLLRYARDQGWNTLEDLKKLDEAMFIRKLPSLSNTPSRDSTFKMPDYKYVHLEMAKPYVSKNFSGDFDDHFSQWSTLKLSQCRKVPVSRSAAKFLLLYLPDKILTAQYS